MSRPAAWVVKASLKAKWKFHWKKYFSCGDDPFWWGDECIGSVLSKKLLREDVAAGDIAICYQKDDPQAGRVVWALSQFKSVEREVGSEDFALCHHDEAFRLVVPLHIDDLRETGCDPECFKHGPVGRGTIGTVDPAEFKGILDAIVMYSVVDAKKLRRWLENVGYRGF